jgi:glycerophosphoryl diester phosphodiesterase
MSSFRLGWRQTDAIECDIHLSKDGRIMVSHDDNTLRATGRDLAIADTDSSELRKLDAGSYKGSEFTGEKIPFLEELLSELPAGCDLFIEIKSNQKMLPLLCELIRNSGKEEQIRVIGFDIDTITEFKRLMPNVPVCWLHSTDGKNPYNLDIIDRVKERGLDGFDLHYIGVDEDLVKAIHSAGLLIYVWTVDNPEDIKYLASTGLDGITTNKPDLAIDSISGG